LDHIPVERGGKADGLREHGGYTGAGDTDLSGDNRSGGSAQVQDFSGAVISGWGWNDNGWASMAGDLYFAVSGTQTLRLQPREDGVFVDQIVLSPSRYLRVAPGALTNDATIVSR
jgi:hypothetical protein